MQSLQPGSVKQTNGSFIGGQVQLVRIIVGAVKGDGPDGFCTGRGLEHFPPGISSLGLWSVDSIFSVLVSFGVASSAIILVVACSSVVSVEVSPAAVASSQSLG